MHLSLTDSDVGGSEEWTLENRNSEEDTFSGRQQDYRWNLIKQVPRSLQLLPAAWEAE